MNLSDHLTNPRDPDFPPKQVCTRASRGQAHPRGTVLKTSLSGVPVSAHRHVKPDEVNTLKMDGIEVKSYVCELVKSFERKAA